MTPKKFFRPRSQCRDVDGGELLVCAGPECGAGAAADAKFAKSGTR
jgi:hypothetical protein